MSETDRTQFPFSEMPLTSQRRTELLGKLMSTPPSMFSGTISDITQMGETWMGRIGYEDEWLLRLSYRNEVL